MEKIIELLQELLIERNEKVGSIEPEKRLPFLQNSGTLHAALETLSEIHRAETA